MVITIIILTDLLKVLKLFEYRRGDPYMTDIRNFVHSYLCYENIFIYYINSYAFNT